MDPTYFSADILDFIGLLAEHKVRYLIVGGEAVIYYGFARLTGDVDFFFERSDENCNRLYAALKSFWGGKVPGVKEYAELKPKGVIFQFGRPPNRIDLINEISAVSFDQAWPKRTIEELKVNDKNLQVLFIGLEDLIANKKQANRYKDLEDLKYLTTCKKK